MTAARLAVSVECRDGGGETGEETLWLSVLAFGRCAEDLARHAKGEPVSVSGRVRLDRYQSREGEDRETWQVLADAVVSSRSVRPWGGRRKGEGNGAAARSAPERGGEHDWRDLAGGERADPRGAPAPASTAPADFDDDIRSERFPAGATTDATRMCSPRMNL